jgi:exopolysaccharide biosynthesis polyprenyl glycosylphosphotransferase
VDVLRGRRDHHVELVGFLDVAHTPAASIERILREPRGAPMRFRADGPAAPPDCPRLGTVDDAVEVLRSHAVDEVVVDAKLASLAAVGAALLTCLQHQCRVTDRATFHERLLGEVPVADINAQWFLSADVQSTTGYEAAKRLVDVVAALIGLLLTLPAWPLIALAIRLESRGSALFRQTRVGRYERPFTIFKFRTMRLDAEADGVRWAARNDARVTRIGQFLRRSRLDELPQLWNILRGEMSLVGPRPERPEFVAQLARAIPLYGQRHLIKPGLTGWAQIHYGYGASVEETQRKLCFDLYYLKHRAVDFDLAIIIRTIGRFVFGAR